MSELIKREDAINAVAELRCRPWTLCLWCCARNVGTE